MVSTTSLESTFGDFAWPTEQVPGSELEEISFDKDVVVFQYMLEVLRIVDDDGRWERWH